MLYKNASKIGGDMLTVNKVGTYSVKTKSNEIKKTSFQPNYSQSAEQQNLPKVSQSTLLAYNNISFGHLLNVKYIPPKAQIFDYSFLEEPFQKMQAQLRKLAQDENSWVNIPSKMLKDNTVDTVYKTMDEFKKPFGADTKAIFIALGNPANADEAVNALGLGHKVISSTVVTKHEFLSDVNKAGGDLDKIQFIISSKSGGTYESNKTLGFAEEVLTEHYKSKGVPEENIQENISKHILCLTDKNPATKLKGAAVVKGYKTIDCPDGVPSGLADLQYFLPLKAYAGLPKSDAIKEIKAADDLTKELLSANSINDNLAAQIAAFDKVAIDNGVTKEQVICHDKLLDFRSTYDQVNELMRKVGFQTHLYPRGAHAQLESTINRELKGQPISNITNIIANSSDKAADVELQELSHMIDAKKQGHWQKVLEMSFKEDSKGIKPEVLGEFSTLKSYVTHFKNEFEGTNLDLNNITFVKGYKDIRDKTTIEEARKFLEN